MEKIVTPTTMDASSHSNMEASPFVAPTKRSIIPLKQQKEEGIKADQTDHKSIDLELEPQKYFFAKFPDIYIMNFVQYKDLLTKAKGNPDIVELTQYYMTLLHKSKCCVKPTPVSHMDRLKI